MKKSTKTRRHAFFLITLYVVIVTICITYAVFYFLKSSSERGKLAFERFSEQLTYRVNDYLGKYTEEMILLKSELTQRQIADESELLNTFQRYIDNSTLEGIGFMLNDGTTLSYTGETEEFDIPIDILDVQNHPSTVTLSQNSILGEKKLLLRMQWNGKINGSPTVCIYGYLPLNTFSDLLKDTSYGNMGAFVSIVDHTGKHLWNSSDTLENKEGHNLITDLERYDLNEGITAEEVATRLDLQLSGLVTYTADGDERILFYKPLGYNNWTLLTITPRASVLNMENEIKIILLLLSGIFSIVILAAWYIHKNRQAELSLAIAQKESLFKEKFLSNVSHEIRTPLNGISGMLHLMKTNLKDTVKHTEYLNHMEDSVAQLNNLVNDVLDMSKIESGNVEVHSERFDLYELIQKTLHTFDTIALQKDVLLRVEHSQLKNRFYIGDAKKIQQIITNLLSNAIKFTPHGTVTLTLTENPQEYKDKVCILVSDTGCGMDLEFQKIIFDAFTQEDTTYGRTQTGTGLGMAIVSELIELLHGTISVQSAPNQGTTFTVWLPLQADEDQRLAEAEIPSKSVSLKGIRILLAEDNEINSMIAEELLTQAGAKVKTVENGQLAVDYFLDSTAEPVDLILMDIRMPVMDGLEAARLIRASNHPRAKSIPILALTANGLERENKDILDAGMNERLSKPLSVQLLYESIQHYVKKFEASSDVLTDL